jgi:O-succinylbenzoic acid--CoA ligase
LLRAEVGGAEVEVMDGFEPGPVAGARERGAHVSVVPTMVHRLLESGAGLGPGGVVLVGGAALAPDLRIRAEAEGARVVQTYGLTESCGGVVYDGEPFAGTEMRVGPSERIELLGPTLMEGYRHDAAATGAAFDTQGWLRTGDAGSLDEDGRLLVRGRLDDAILTGAETVWPDEVERVLLLHQKVREVVIAGRPHPEWGQQVVAFVVAASIEDPPTLSELRAWCADQVASFKAPRALTLLSEIPKTVSGKVRRSALPS